MDAASKFSVATTFGGSASSPVDGSIPGQATPLYPELQTQDGSFVGSVGVGPSPGIATQWNMVAFNQSGSVLWSVANEFPQIATADGGVVGASGVTYDNQGRATGQLGSLPIQSWRGNAYTDGPVDRVAFTPSAVATTLWAQIGGNPSGQSTAARPWYFKLVFQNIFSLYPDHPEYLPNLTIDLTSQAAAIKSAALAALKKAYDKYPVNVSEGSAGTGDNRANVVNGVNSQGGGSQSCGLSSQFGGSHDSNVYYLANMENAQWALPIAINNSQDLQRAAGRVDLMNAIGTGIGNNAAHEIAHQFFLDSYGMDDSSSNTYNGQGCDGQNNPWVYTGTNGTTPIHWEGVTDQALQNTLRTGWHK